MKKIKPPFISRAKILLYFLLLFIVTSFTNKAYAASLANVSDTLTTSRPSASTPLSANIAAGVGSFAVYNNGSTFLASDSATLWGQTPETVTISTSSAAKTTLFTTSETAQAHTNGTVVATPVTAVHTIKFTTSTTIPADGSFTISFPRSDSSDTNQASPSASTFMLNGLPTGNIKANFSAGSAACTFSAAGTAAGSVPTITCNIGTDTVNGGTVVTVLLGCASAGTSCAIANQRPSIINPTKTAVSGTADTWSVKLTTFSAADAGGTALDNATTKIGTVDSVSVVARVDPTFTFVVGGVVNGTALSGASLCGGSHAADTTNSGFGTTPSEVNLGTLTASGTSRAAQTMTITSNAISGYTITATSSGHLINPATGYWVADAQGTPTGNDTPAPAPIVTGTAAFGIHACDANSKVTTGTWGQATAEFANPSTGYYYTLVSSGVVPAGSGDLIVVEYAATVAGATPPGDYTTTLTYVATPIF